MSILKKYVIFTSALFFLVLFALVLKNDFEKSSNRILHEKEIDPVYAVNFSDDRILVGASHNIFVGKVIKQIGTKLGGMNPETQFAVQIVSNIKGALDGVASVNQEGGYENGVLYVIDPNSDIPTSVDATSSKGYFLQIGSTYLFATRYDSTDNSYTLNSFSGASKLLSSDAASDISQLQELASNDPRVQQLEAAYSHEILLAADVAHNNTLNSYASLHPAPPPPRIIPTSTVQTSTDKQTLKIQSGTSTATSSLE